MSVPPTIGTWNGEDLKGQWHVTIKIDGVRALWVFEGEVMGGRWLSRAGTPLFNVPPPDDTSIAHNCELYLGSLKETNRAWRTKHLKPDTPRILPEHLYSLDPLDPRLDHGFIEDPSAAYIIEMLRRANSQGFEGLVLRQGDKWLKVKPHDTFDVRVISAHEGEGKHKGRLGYVKTSLGDVGTGWSDALRQQWWNQRHRLPGITIEVECMQLTPDGKFRHARFIRERFDKIAER